MNQKQLLWIYVLFPSSWTHFKLTTKPCAKHKPASQATDAMFASYPPGFFLLHIFFEFISMPLSLPETNRFLHLKKNEGEEMLGILFYFPFQFGWFLGFHGNFQGVVRSCSEGIFQPVKVFKPPFLPSFRLVKSVRPLYILVVSVQISARFLKKLGFFLLRSKKTTWMREYTKNI